MSIEIEKKYRLTPEIKAGLAARFANAGALHKCDVFEENFLYRDAALAGRGGVLRIRKAGGIAVLTYKERVLADDNLKHRIEFETEVANADAAENIIKALGYSLVLIYEKYRETWHFRDVEIVVDELPYGLYMEIEGTPEAIAATETELALNDLEPEPRGYPTLTTRHGREIDGVFEARFTGRT